MINPLTHRKILKRGTPGRATIVASSVPARDASSFNMAMTLHVYVEGRSPYEVEDQWMVKSRDTAALHGSIPVKVDPEEPTRVAIDWDTLRAEHRQHEEARRAALAAQGPVSDPSTAAVAGLLGALGLDGLAGGDGLDGPGNLDGLGSLGGATVVGATASVDARDDPVLRAKLQEVLGHELVPGQTITVDGSDPALQARILQVVAEHRASTSAAPPAAPTGARDDRTDPDESDDDLVSRLERLTALHEAGALSTAEFRTAKQRLLDGQG